MSEYEPTSPWETYSADPESDSTSRPKVVGAMGGAAPPPPLPPASPSDWPISATMPERADGPKVRRSLTRMKQGLIVVAALVVSVTGFFVGTGTSSAGAAQSVAASSSTGHLGSGGQGSNARSGPAAGGSSGTVTSVSKSGFTMTTSAGQKVTVDEESSTKYKRGSNSISASAIKRGTHVLVLGTVSSTTIKATQVVVQTGNSTSDASTAASVVPFQKGSPTTSKQVGQIPTSYTEGSGTIQSGSTATKATEAALAAYPGGVVDRVVKLSNGEYEVHTIGVNWPHHVFVNQDFKVVGVE
jgi:hypothetical protein